MMIYELLRQSGTAQFKELLPFLNKDFGGEIPWQIPQERPMSCATARQS